MKGYNWLRIVPCVVAVIALLGSLAGPSFGSPRKWFDDGRNGPYFRDDELAIINQCPSDGTGKFIAMPTDTHRADFRAAGNYLAAYYNYLASDYATGRTATEEANYIYDWELANFTSTGGVPDWIILNEISKSDWNSSTYRVWLRNVVNDLHDYLGQQLVVLYSPWGTNVPTNDDYTWQRLATNCYIAMEVYESGNSDLDGPHIYNHSGYGSSTAYCQAKYAAVRNAYSARGLDWGRLYICEHYANNVAGSGCGRCGISSSAWNTVISAKSNGAAAMNNLMGFLSYGWRSSEPNNMPGLSWSEVQNHISTYVNGPDLP